MKTRAVSGVLSAPLKKVESPHVSVLIWISGPAFGQQNYSLFLMQEADWISICHNSNLPYFPGIGAT